MGSIREEVLKNLRELNNNYRTENKIDEIRELQEENYNLKKLNHSLILFTKDILEEITKNNNKYMIMIDKPMVARYTDTETEIYMPEPHYVEIPLREEVIQDYYKKINSYIGGNK